LHPLILHIETSSLACSAALSRGTEVIAARTLYEKYVHSSALAPLAAEILQEAGVYLSDLFAIAVSNGPGSYTGLRVGLSFAKGLCTVLKCHLLTVDTLESIALTAMAADAVRADIYVSTLDARRSDVYIGVFDSNGERIESNSFITVTEDVLDRWRAEGNEIVICGEGVAKWALFAGQPGVDFREIGCDARNLVKSAVQAIENQAFADIATSVPAYLKDPNITISR
jgi:tRNA threonylcarbamoyladenosine biosynthesis protein TsaB